MIKGVGIDIVEVERIQKSIEKEKGFRELVFSPHEITYCEAKTNKYQHYAARFAAKEAFFKAIGTGWSNGTAFNEIEIYNEPNGKPGIRLLEETAQTLQSFQQAQMHVSLSHTATIATVIVVVEME